jgi:hypothetical protein
MSAPIVFMDTECDGLRPDRKVWEVAIVRREPEALGVESASEDERHTAMGDVRWVMRMYDAIMGSAS